MNQTKDRSNPPIEAIVVGASAGGVEALLRSSDTCAKALACPSWWCCICRTSAKANWPVSSDIVLAVPVEEARDKQDIVPGTLYVATPGYHLSVEADRSLSLSLEEPVHHSRPSIDVLFESAADVYGQKLLAVVLTGANNDGACGLAKVRALGGITVVQDPGEAQVSTMPEAALALHEPDHILTLQGIGQLLAGLE